MKKQLLIALLLVYILPTFACTTAVISGKYTDDGKPLLWKVRDTDFLKNKLHYFQDGKYAFVGLVNTIDTLNSQVWAGSNDQGFAIMNSASFNVNLQENPNHENINSKKKQRKDQEGYVMKKALQTCASLKEFELLLTQLPHPMGLASHFGVIDAQGGAAFYEVNNDTFTKFDANNSNSAPDGYILRTNFSYTGKKNIGYGFIRYQTAQNMFMLEDAKNKICAQTCMQTFSRCFQHAVLNKDFRKEYEDRTQQNNCFINSDDLITRHDTSSALTIQGVTPNQDRDMSTIWVQIAYPNTCVTLPVWVRGKDNFPTILQANDSNHVLLSDWAMILKDKCYPIKRSSGYKYLLINQLFNKEKTGYLQKIETFEKHIFNTAHFLIKKWNKNSPSINELKRYYTKCDQEVTDFYQQIITQE